MPVAMLIVPRAPAALVSAATTSDDVHVVARRLAAAVERRLLALPQLQAEDRDHPRLAVRALARPVDVPQPADAVSTPYARDHVST